jgi:hypothetical protein
MTVADCRRMLHRGATSVVVDPVRGGELAAMAIDGRQVLATVPWERAARPTTEAPSEDQWTDAWSGGWQLALPNAGDAGELDGVAYSFHGLASFSPWELLADFEDRVSLGWSAGGLRVLRHVTVLDRGVHVACDVAVDGHESVALIITEHLILGATITDDGYRIIAPDAPFVDLLSAERTTVRWRDVSAHGDPATWSVVSATDHRARYGALGPVDRGEVQLFAGSGIELELTWDASLFPYLWIWQEQLGTDAAPWLGSTRALGLEPSTVGQGDGLAPAVARGTALIMGPGEHRSWTITLNERDSSTNS